MGTAVIIPDVQAVKVPGFFPTTVTGLKVDVDFTDISTLFQDTGRTTPVTADGQAIKGITDKSGQGNHLSNATGCTYKVNLVNGKSAGRFLIASSNQIATAAFGAALSQPNTLFVVVDVLTLSSYPVVYDGIASSHQEQLYVDAAASHWGLYAGTVADVSVAATSVFTLHNAVFNGASSNAWVNGTQRQTNVNTNTQDLTGLRLGADATGASRLNGDIGRVLLYNANLSSTDRDYVKNGLAAQFGLTVA